MNKIKYLTIALKEAQINKGLTSPNPSVGAVLVKDNKIISKGATQSYGLEHAEVIAIKKAGNKTKNSILYVTLEPCCFYGKNPSCVNLIIKSGIKKVIIGVIDPNPKINGKGITQLKNAGIELEYGFLEKKINLLNEDFYKYIKTNLPFVSAKYAMTLDGKIATSNYDSKWISNEKSRLEIHKLRKITDVILVGVNTIIYDNPKLTCRLKNKFIKNDFLDYQPLRVILDTHAKTPLNSNVLIDEFPSLFIIKSSIKKDLKFQKFIKKCESNKNKKILFDESKNKSISLKILMKKLAEQKKTSVLIEGGAKVLANAMNEKIIDKIICFIAPKIIMGEKSLSPFKGKGIDKMSDAILLKNIMIKKIKNDIMFTGYLNDKSY